MNTIKNKWLHLLCIAILTMATIASAQIPADNCSMSASETIMSNVITHHPSPKISKDLRSMIEARSFLLQEHTDDATTFGLAYFDVTPDGIPIMGFSAAGLLNPKTSIEELMIAVYHEFRHYEQWRDNIFSAQHKYRSQGDQALNQEGVISCFYGEMDAFCMTTEFVQAQNWINFDRASQIYSEQGAMVFAKQLVDSMTRDPRFNVHRVLLLELAENWEE
jgi:hypothetical protein